jgi:hypothetical protein
MAARRRMLGMGTLSDVARCPTQVRDAPLNGHLKKRPKSALLTDFVEEVGE